MSIHPNSSSPVLFKKVLFGFAFSPNLENNLYEVFRVCRFLGAELTLLHVGACTEKKKAALSTLLDQIPNAEVVSEVLWREGDPFQTIYDQCDALSIDLLMIGAQRHETLFRFYVGSVARKLTRRVNCSVLLLTNASRERVACKHVVVNGVLSDYTADAINAAFFVGQRLGARQLTIVEEIAPNKVQVAVDDDRSLVKSLRKKHQLELREDERVRSIVAAVPASFKEGVSYRTQPIFGKRGYSIGHYAEISRADLLVLNAEKHSSIFKRIITRDIEFILSDLPCELLIIRPKKEQNA